MRSLTIRILLIGLLVGVATSLNDDCCPGNPGWNCLCDDNVIGHEFNPPCDPTQTNQETQCPSGYDCVDDGWATTSSNGVCCQTCGDPINQAPLFADTVTNNPADITCRFLPTDEFHCGSCGHQCPSAGEQWRDADTGAQFTVQNDYHCFDGECIDSCGLLGTGPDAFNPTTSIIPFNVWNFGWQSPTAGIHYAPNYDYDPRFCGSCTEKSCDRIAIDDLKTLVSFVNDADGRSALEAAVAANPSFNAAPATKLIPWVTNPDAHYWGDFCDPTLPHNDPALYFTSNSLECPQGHQAYHDLIAKQIGGLLFLGANGNHHDFASGAFVTGWINGPGPLNGGPLAPRAPFGPYESVPDDSDGALRTTGFNAAFGGHFVCGAPTADERDGEPCCTSCTIVDFVDAVNDPTTAGVDFLFQDHCTDLFHDEHHCGICNNACADIHEGYSCVQGKCCETCSEHHQSDDDGIHRCLDLQTDNTHCGYCGHACDAGTEHCVHGSCEPKCRSVCHACVLQHTELQACQPHTPWNPDTPVWCLDCCDSCCDGDVCEGDIAFFSNN